MTELRWEIPDQAWNETESNVHTSLGCYGVCEYYGYTDLLYNIIPVNAA